MTEHTHNASQRNELKQLLFNSWSEISDVVHCNHPQTGKESWVPAPGGGAWRPFPLHFQHLFPNICILTVCSCLPCEIRAMSGQVPGLVSLWNLQCLIQYLELCRSSTTTACGINEWTNEWISPVRWWLVPCTRGLAAGDDCEANDKEERWSLLFKVIAKFRAGRTDADLPNLKACSSFSQLAHTFLKPSNAFSPPDQVTAEANQFSG